MDNEREPLLGTSISTSINGGYSAMEKPFSRQTVLHVDRPVFFQDDLNAATLYKKPTFELKKTVRKTLKEFRCKSCFLNSVPILRWITYYKWKKYIGSDVLAGITVAIMNIPQGMGYGLLGNVPPIVGIYMAFFPALIYMFFGSSKHASMGTFSVVCLLTGKVVEEYSVSSDHDPDSSSNFTYSPIVVASTVCFTVACMQLIMYVMRLGILTTLLSETLVQGFTCASSVQVITYQLKDLFGLPIRKRGGYFNLPFVLYDSIVALPQANRVAAAISIVSIVAMVLNNEIFKPILAKRTKIPFPIELVVVIFGTIVVRGFNMNEAYNVTIVGDIPAGLPVPALPAFGLIPYILVDSFVICMVAYSTTISMALIIAQKSNYEIDSNQELLAMGLSNGFASFFSCMPFCASLSRTIIQHAVGGVTQLTSFVMCLVVLVILLWIGPFFETLPRAILASVIVVSLKSMVFQIEQVPKFWRISKWDAFVWIVTFGTAVSVSVDIGLGVGCAVSLVSLLVRGFKAYTCLLGVYPGTDIYLDVKRYKGVQEIGGIKIFHYCGSFNFATQKMFRDALYHRTRFDPAHVYRQRNQTNNHGEDIEIQEASQQKCVVLDFSACTYIDKAGVKELRFLKAQYQKINVAMYVAACSGPVYEMLKTCDKHEKIDSELVIFATVHDAVTYAQQNLFDAMMPPTS